MSFFIIKVQNSTVRSITEYPFPHRPPPVISRSTFAIPFEIVTSLQTPSIAPDYRILTILLRCALALYHRSRHNRLYKIVNCYLCVLIINYFFIQKPKKT